MTWWEWLIVIVVVIIVLVVIAALIQRRRRTGGVVISGKRNGKGGGPSMSLLMKATEIVTRPVVTLAGEDVAQIRDVVYDDDGVVVGFTLAGRGIFAGPRKDALPWAGLTALGPDALMVTGEEVFVPREEIVEKAARKSGSKGGLVLGSRVLTDGGVDLGAVTDVVLEVGNSAVVRGYEIDPTDALPGNRHRALIPLPDTIAVSGEALVVPASITGFVADDLAGFGAAVDAFRAQLSGGTS